MGKTKSKDKRDVYYRKAKEEGLNLKLVTKKIGNL